MKIYIPTYKRVDKQITFHNLPAEFQKDVTFIINECEKDLSFFKDKLTIVVPDHFKIAEKREEAFKNSSNEKFAVFDDDIRFLKRIENHTHKLITAEDFSEMFDFFSSVLDEPNVFLTNPKGTYLIPNLLVEYEEAIISGQVNFFDGTKLLKENVKWTGLEQFEDIYVIMQMLSKGYVNRIYNKYCYAGSQINSEGGCSTHRTSTTYNESLVFLKRQFPEYIQIKKDKDHGYVGIKPGEMMKHRILLNRLYKDSLKRIKSKKIFL